MPKMTKAQKRRMVMDIQKKTQKLYFSHNAPMQPIVSTQDLVAIDKLCSKWMKRIV